MLAKWHQTSQKALFIMFDLSDKNSQLPGLGRSRLSVSRTLQFTEAHHSLTPPKPPTPPPTPSKCAKPSLFTWASPVSRPVTPAGSSVRAPNRLAQKERLPARDVPVIVFSGPMRAAFFPPPADIFAPAVPCPRGPCPPRSPPPRSQLLSIIMTN